MAQKVAGSNPELGQLTTRKFPLNGYRFALYVFV